MSDNHLKRGRAVRRSRSAALVTLLAFALILTGILGWQALDAERSHRAAAENALTDYASFAAWQMNQHAGQGILSAMISTFIVPLTRVDPAKPEAWPSPQEFMAASLQPPAPAPYLKGIRFYFRLDWRDSVDGKLRIVCYVLSRDYDGRLLVTYGFETDARAFIQPLFDSVLVRTTLLPPSLLRDVNRDSIMTVKAWAPSGGQVYASHTGFFDKGFTVVDSLDERFARLHLGYPSGRR